MVSIILCANARRLPLAGDSAVWGELGLTSEIDLLAAGFPCTDISCAGRQAGLEREGGAA